MAVTHRLRELRAAGKHELADTLAVEALRNERPEVRVEGDHVRVRTETFVGEHALAGSFDPSDEDTVREAVSRRGTYALGEDATGRTFSTGCLFDAVVDALVESRPGTEEPAEPTATSQPTPGTPTPETETATADDAAMIGPAEPDRSTTSVLRQAVAAVQSQFRS
ncbi:hypothetical protein [Halomarina rubra]|uniref:Uncharacterized protein n=1 Tax=Halomarina rubra TaxID=2071873 RepID=A0ABD6AXX0_9EURY|nr:hypothetical protein [Halomarina rubra]